jgi:hypothetical protein
MIFFDKTGNFLNQNRNGLFFFLLILVFLFLNYQYILFLQPQGIHFIRQTDSLSFVRYYMHNGMHFFEPGILNLSSNGGKAACEFPILYYITALIYLATGEHEFILRLINIVIVTFGFFSLFRLLQVILKDIFYAFTFTFLYFSSTVLIYYTNNFLPDAAALGFSLAGWFYSYRFLLDRNKSRSLFSGFMFFALSSLIKVTFFINPITFILVLLITDQVSVKKLLINLKSNFRPLVLFALTFTVVVAWNLYVIWYNRLNHDHYFLVTARPIWTMSRTGISTVFDYMTNYWYSRYYYQSTIHVFTILIISGLVLIRFAEFRIQLLSLILLTGSILYFLLFFEQFQNHDYYFIALIPGIIFITISSFINIKHKFPLVAESMITRSALLILCVLSLNYARQKLADRYEKQADLYADIGNDLRDIKQYLDQLGVARSEKVVLVTDLTPNGGLYFLDRPGWNLKDTSGRSMQYLMKFMNKGAGYMILTDSIYQENRGIRRFLGAKIGEKNNIRIFKTTRNF